MLKTDLESAKFKIECIHVLFLKQKSFWQGRQTMFVIHINFKTESGFCVLSCLQERASKPKSKVEARIEYVHQIFCTLDLAST